MAVMTSPVEEEQNNPAGDDPASSSSDRMVAENDGFYHSPNPASSTRGDGSFGNSNHAPWGGGSGSFNSPNPALSWGLEGESVSFGNSYQTLLGLSSGTIGGVNNNDDVDINNNNNNCPVAEPPRPPYGTEGRAASTPSYGSDDSHRDARSSSLGTLGATTPTSYSSVYRRRATTNSDPSTPGGSSSQRISDLRHELSLMGDVTDAEISVMLIENDRASEELRLSQMSFEVGGGSFAVGGSDSLSRSMSRSSTSSSLRARAGAGGGGGGGGGNSSRNNNSSNTGGARRRRWHPCEQPQSRPGAYSTGISTGGARANGQYDVGFIDPIELEMKKIDAISSVKNTLNQRLGYVLPESQYEEMERKYREEESAMMASSHRRRDIRPTLPAMMMWDAPPPSRRSQVIKEPDMPVLSGPLPFPWSFGASSRGSDGGMDYAVRSPDGVVEETNDVHGRTS
jgi:hypothetical protein